MPRKYLGYIPKDRGGYYRGRSWGGTETRRAFAASRGFTSRGTRFTVARGAGGGGAIARGRRRAALSAQMNPRTGGFTGIELKFLDCAFNGNAILSSATWAGGEMQPTTGCTLCISCPAQGDGEQHRDGRRFVMKSIYVNGCVDSTPANDQPAPFQSSAVFFALVLDTQANAATIVSENVYVNNSSSGICAPYPLRKLEFSQRYQVLDRQYAGGKIVVAAPDHATNSSTNANIPCTRTAIKLSWSGNIAVNCTGTTADVASVADNAIHVLAICEDTVHTPNFFGQSRMRFVG